MSRYTPERASLFVETMVASGADPTASTAYNKMSVLEILLAKKATELLVVVIVNSHEEIRTKALAALFHSLKVSLLQGCNMTSYSIR